jgi:hypothetical protein
VKVSPARYRQRALVPWRRSRSRQSRSLPHEEGLGQPKPPTKKKKAPERGVPGLTVWGHHGRVSPWDRSPSSKATRKTFLSSTCVAQRPLGARWRMNRSCDWSPTARPYLAVATSKWSRLVVIARSARILYFSTKVLKRRAAVRSRVVSNEMRSLSARLRQCSGLSIRLAF